MPSILDTGKQEAEKAALAQVQKNHAEVDLTASGVQASIDTVRWHTTFTAYVKRLWGGKTEAGAKITRDF